MDAPAGVRVWFVLLLIQPPPLRMWEMVQWGQNVLELNPTPEGYGRCVVVITPYLEMFDYLGSLACESEIISWGF